MFGFAFAGTSLDGWIIILYFLFILGFGSIFSKFTKTTKDFFFGGQRFSWWLISISCIATLVGSYSFIKYSEYAYKYGTSSSMSYLNDWFILPLFIFGWLPLIYFSRVTSIPEYFEKRFSKTARLLVTALIMVYLLGYIGYNLYTMGIAVNQVLGIDIYAAVFFTAIICAIYVAAGGQTSVIMTDLAQGFLLIGAGFLLFFLGLNYIGGWKVFWNNLPVDCRMPFTGVTEPARFSTVGIFWQDAIANSMVFYFMNQGMMLRFLSVKSVKEGKKALIIMTLFLMPITMFAVNNAGWIGRAIPKEDIIKTEVQMENSIAESQGKVVDYNAPIDPKREVNTKSIFVTVSKLLCMPGFFGLIMAALLAALMSTIDTLINATSVIFVNDIWKAYIRPNKPDKHYLFTARWFSVVATLIGIVLVPIFTQAKSLYEAHATFTAAITPPLVVAIVLGAFWKRMSSKAVCATLIGGVVGIAISFQYPDILYYFSCGVGKDGYGFIRAFYGLIVSFVCGVIVAFCTKPADPQKIVGYVCGTLKEAAEKYKGSPLTKESNGRKTYGSIVIHNELPENVVCVSEDAMYLLEAEPNDLFYVCDARGWLGGMRSMHVKAGKAHDNNNEIWLSQATMNNSSLLLNKKAFVEKIM